MVHKSGENSATKAHLDPFEPIIFENLQYFGLIIVDCLFFHVFVEGEHFFDDDWDGCFMR